MVKKLVGALAVVVVLLGAGFYWFVLRGDAPEELSLDSGSDGDGSVEPAGEAPGSYDGEWVVRTGGDTTAGFRIDEEFAGGVADHEAVGRTPDIEGGITVEGTEVPEGSFTLDLTTLEFDDDPPSGSVDGRAAAMEGQGLETRDFPEGTFELTESLDLGEEPTDGFEETIEATGDLTLHGVTKEITFSVDARAEGDTIRVATSEPVPVALADHDIEEPSAPFVASVSDEGSFEFLLVLEKG